MLRTLLSQHSTVFRELLTSDAYVAATNSIVIKSDDIGSIEPFANYFYTQRINSALTLHYALNLINLAINYEVQGLKKLTIKHVKTLLSFYNVHIVLNRSSNWPGVKELNDACFDLIYDYRDAYETHENFDRLNKMAQDLVIKECY